MDERDQWPDPIDDPTTAYDVDPGDQAPGEVTQPVSLPRPRGIIEHLPSGVRYTPLQPADEQHQVPTWSEPLAPDRSPDPKVVASVVAGAAGAAVATLVGSAEFMAAAPEWVRLGLVLVVGPVAAAVAGYWRRSPYRP